VENKQQENKQQENKQHLVMENGTRDSITWEFDGIRMGHAVSKFREYSHFEASSTNTDVVRLHIGLAGNYSFDYRQLDTSFDLIGGHHNIMYSKDFDMVVHNRTLELETFGVQFPRGLFLQFTQNASDLLQRFAGHIMEGKSIILTDEWGAVGPPIQQVVHQIVHNKYAGDLQRLFLLSKSIELLVLCADSCYLAEERKMGQTEIYIKTAADKEKIIAVRDLINQRVHCPPNLSEIARTVGLNEYKLKRGFKETFHTTVFGYLTEQRLLLARHYLRDTDKTAAEISFELGYSTPQHFNNAFKKHFGTTPDIARKNP
jgi:AraC family transcriptional regulator, transcriptional activator of the genes for pyochelin and ferripyochelin receptors